MTATQLLDGSVPSGFEITEEATTVQKLDYFDVSSLEQAIRDELRQPGHSSEYMTALKRARNALNGLRRFM